MGTIGFQHNQKGLELGPCSLAPGLAHWSCLKFIIAWVLLPWNSLCNPTISGVHSNSANAENADKTSQPRRSFIISFVIVVVTIEKCSLCIEFSFRLCTERHQFPEDRHLLQVLLPVCPKSLSFASFSVFSCYCTDQFCLLLFPLLGFIIYLFF